MIKIMKAYANDDEDQLLAEVDGELKRCPFCGSEGEICGDGENYYRAACSKCPVEICEIYFTLEEAVDAWNGRAEDVSPMQKCGAESRLEATIADLESACASLPAWAACLYCRYYPCSKDKLAECLDKQNDDDWAWEWRGLR